MGGTKWHFAVLAPIFAVTYVVSPFLSLWFLGSLYVLKAATDWRAGFPIWVTLCTPLSFLLGSLLQIDSAVAHWRGRVVWKDRRV
jgi:hypothetical protein